MKFLGRKILKAFSRLGDTGMSRGTRGDGAWLAVGLVVAGFRLMARLGRRKREVVYSRELEPGETLEIRHLNVDRKGRPVG
ncbi:MAG TPA: hypothetical protein ENI86_11495 [Acidimicrobiales bacterium]|nr:hypothetical protein [Acidimicrobiales bacterium]